MLSLMSGPEPRGQFRMQAADAGRPIGVHLLADGKMEREMKERILRSALRWKLRLHGRALGFQERVILGVLCDQLRDLRLERLQRFTSAELAPRVYIDAAQIGASLLVKDRHVVSLAVSP